MVGKNRLLQEISRRLDLPPDAICSDPCVELQGKRTLTITGHRGIVGFEADCIGISTTLGVLRVCGQGLRMQQMNRERIVLYGRIDGVRWEEAKA